MPDNSQTVPNERDREVYARLRSRNATLADLVAYREEIEARLAPAPAQSREEEALSSRKLAEGIVDSVIGAFKKYYPCRPDERIALIDAIEAAIDKHDDALRARLSATADSAREMREPVRWFAERMEEKLRANDHKGRWIDCSEYYLLKHLREETLELDHALLLGEDVTSKAADVANFAMMIADKARAALERNTKDVIDGN